MHHPTTRRPLEPQSVTHVAPAQIHLSQPRENAHHPPPGHLRRQVCAHGHDSRCGKTLQFFPPSHHAVLAISLMRIRGPLAAFFFIKKGGLHPKLKSFPGERHQYSIKIYRIEAVFKACCIISVVSGLVRHSDRPRTVPTAAAGVAGITGGIGCTALYMEGADKYFQAAGAVDAVTGATVRATICIRIQLLSTRCFG